MIFFLVLFAFFEVVPQHTDVVNLFCKKTTRIYASFTGQLTITVNRIIHDDGDTGPVSHRVIQDNGNTYFDKSLDESHKFPTKLQG